MILKKWTFTAMMGLALVTTPLSLWAEDVVEGEGEEVSEFEENREKAQNARPGATDEQLDAAAANPGKGKKASKAYDVYGNNTKKNKRHTKYAVEHQKQARAVHKSGKCQDISSAADRKACQNAKDRAKKGAVGKKTYENASKREVKYATKHQKQARFVHETGACGKGNPKKCKAAKKTAKTGAKARRKAKK